MQVAKNYANAKPYNTGDCVVAGPSSGALMVAVVEVMVMVVPLVVMVVQVIVRGGGGWEGRMRG